MWGVKMNILTTREIVAISLGILVGLFSGVILGINMAGLC